MMVAPQKKTKRIPKPIKCASKMCAIAWKIGQQTEKYPRSLDIGSLLTAPHETPFVHDFNCYLRALLILE